MLEFGQIYSEVARNLPLTRSCVKILHEVVFNFFFFSFFQAEDGIRDFHVTGVQTCALPISGVGGAQIGWYRLIAIPHWAIAHEESAAATSPKAFSASSYENECITTTPPSNRAWT